MVILQIVTIIICVTVLALLINIIEDYKDPHPIINTSYNLEYIEQFEVPVIKCSQGTKEFYFLIDTGASDCVLDSSKSVLNYKALEGTSSVYGIEGNVQMVSFVEATFMLGATEFTEEFQCLDMGKCFSNSEREFGIEVAGILGSSFLRKHKLAVDIANNALYSL